MNKGHKRAKNKEMVLLLTNRNLNDKKIQQLASKGTAEVTSLQIGRNKITWKGIEIISKCPWNRLVHLSLGGNRDVTNKGCRMLSKGNFPLIQQLSLSKDKSTIQMTAQGVHHLSKMPFPELKALEMNGNSFKDVTGRQICDLHLSQDSFESFSAINCRMSGETTKNILLAQWKRVKELSMWMNLVEEFIEKKLNMQLVYKWPKALSASI